MEIVALLLMTAGLAYLFGARELGVKCLRASLGAVLLLSFVRCVMTRCGFSRAAMVEGVGPWVPVMLVTGALALVGYVAWRTRSSRGADRERRNGSPRERELPIPREADEEVLR